MIGTDSLLGSRRCVECGPSERSRMKKYRRIEVNAYQRRVTVVSGEWPPDDLSKAESGQTDDGVSLDDSDACEPVSPDSPEGQVILVEAVRTLEQRLTPETRATIGAGQNTIVAN